jgi:hypothetical protein
LKFSRYGEKEDQCARHLDLRPIGLSFLLQFQLYDIALHKHECFPLQLIDKQARSAQTTIANSGPSSEFGSLKRIGNSNSNASHLLSGQDPKTRKMPMQGICLFGYYPCGCPYQTGTLHRIFGSFAS